MADIQPQVKPRERYHRLSPEILVTMGAVCPEQAEEARRRQTVCL
jgi:hypothetical protein